MPVQQANNYVQSTLASGCTSAAVTLSVVSVSGWPTTGNFMLRIDDVAGGTFEYVEVTSVNVGANQVTVTRGQEGTTGIAHLAGAFVGNDLTAAMLQRGTVWNENQFHAEVWQGTLQSIPNNAATQVAWDTVEADSNSNFTTGAAAKYTCPVAGRYQVTATALFASTVWASPAISYLSVFVNGVEKKRGGQTAMSGTNFSGPHPLAVVVRCNAADTIDVRLFQNNGAAVNTSPGQALMALQVLYEGAL